MLADMFVVEQPVCGNFSNTILFKINKLQLHCYLFLLFASRVRQMCINTLQRHSQQPIVANQDIQRWHLGVSDLIQETAHHIQVMSIAFSIQRDNTTTSLLHQRGINQEQIASAVKQKYSIRDAVGMTQQQTGGVVQGSSLLGTATSTTLHLHRPQDLGDTKAARQNIIQLEGSHVSTS